jgi:hypothetical protein
MPPRFSFSTMAVFMPNCEARIAVTYPPGPLPSTTTSYCAIIYKFLVIINFDAKLDKIAYPQNPF